MSSPPDDDARPRARHKGIGLKEFVYDVRHRRYRYRQYMNVLYFTVLMIVGYYEPNQVLGLFTAGACIAALGVVVRLWASGCVKKNEELATDGPYAFVRHPLYVGNFLIGSGFALASGFLYVLPIWWLYFAYYHSAAIKREDRKLRNRFPETWDGWAAQTPALLPVALLKLQKCPRIGPWSLRQSLHNGEPLYAFGLTCGMLWLGRLLIWGA